MPKSAVAAGCQNERRPFITPCWPQSPITKWGIGPDTLRDHVNGLVASDISVDDTAKAT